MAHGAGLAGEPAGARPVPWAPKPLLLLKPPSRPARPARRSARRARSPRRPPRRRADGPARGRRGQGILAEHGGVERHRPGVHVQPAAGRVAAVAAVATLPPLPPLPPAPPLPPLPPVPPGALVPPLPPPLKPTSL